MEINLIDMIILTKKNLLTLEAKWTTITLNSTKSTTKCAVTSNGLMNNPPSFNDNKLK